MNFSIASYKKNCVYLVGISNSSDQIQCLLADLPMRMLLLFLRTPVRRPGDQLRQPNQVAVAAPAEKELAQAARALEKQVALAEAEEQKEVKIEVKTSKPVAAAAADAEVAPPTAKVVARPRVEAPGKADTVKMGTKVVGSDGTKEKAQARIQRYGEG